MFCKIILSCVLLQVQEVFAIIDLSNDTEVTPPRAFLDLTNIETLQKSAAQTDASAEMTLTEAYALLHQQEAQIHLRKSIGDALLHNITIWEAEREIWKQLTSNT